MHSVRPFYETILKIMSGKWQTIIKFTSGILQVGTIVIYAQWYLADILARCHGYILGDKDRKFVSDYFQR